jgi:UDP-galactopyranose mutase
VETVTALIILAMVTSSVLVVIDRCISSTADSAMRRQAFEVARDNMEAVLTSSLVSEMVEVGTSDKYPEIQWQTSIEPFYEPVTKKMWVQATCSAEYTDTAGELQTVELTHWLTDLTKEQLLEIIEQRQIEKQRLAKEEAEQEPAEEPPKPEEDCDALPYCEKIDCYFRTGRVDELNLDTIIQYFFECK